MFSKIETILRVIEGSAGSAPHHLQAAPSLPMAWIF